MNSPTKISSQTLSTQPGMVAGAGILCISFLFMYFPFLKTLVHAWGQNPNYSHGYFIPFMAAYLAYTQREKLRSTPITPAATSGFLVLVIGILQAIVAQIANEYFMQRTSMIIVLLGIVLFLLGKKHLTIVWFPICYLIFMIPIPTIVWNKIAFPLQIFASFLTQHIINLIGIPIYREGNILHLAQTTLEVVDACSGLRSLVTMFALSTFIGWTSALSSLKKWILFAAGAFAAVLANIIRLTVTAVLASRYGEQVAQGFLHEFSGMVTFLLGLAILAATYRLLQKTS